jgi:hypothetical protein
MVDKEPGHVWIEGTDIHYIDQSGYEYSITGEATVSGYIV